MFPPTATTRWLVQGVQQRVNLAGRSWNEMGERPRVAEIELAIRHYLRVHPHAVDTERGIREWWVHAASNGYHESEVCNAIHGLVATGEVVERLLPNGEYIYASAATIPPHTS
jgi:hypothetical protein